MYNSGMLQRIFIVLTLAALPFNALADDIAPSPNSSPAATAAPSDGTATSAGLGPDAVSPSAGGSNGDSTALQPAGLSPIQSGATDSTGLTAPAGVLQAPATGAGQLKVLAGEVDGAPHQVENSNSTPWGWLAAIIMVLLLVAAAVIWRDRRRFTG
ncbi:MAG: hypothetical protein NVSMB39_3500 [Candidatus Saccharimonadales bacterium]